MKGNSHSIDNEWQLHPDSKSERRGFQRSVPESEQRFQSGAHMAYHPQYQYQAAAGENASYYDEAQSRYSQNKPTTGEPNDERGFGSTVVGCLAGGYVANQMGAGPMGTTGGAILGVTGMDMAANTCML